MEDRSHRPTFWSLSLGTVLGLIATLLILAIAALSPVLLDRLVNLALFIPDNLGFVDHVTSDDVIEVVAPVSQLVQLPKAGIYKIHAAGDDPAIYRIVLRSQAGGDPVPVFPLPAWRTPSAPPLSSIAGAPMFEFFTQEAGAFSVSVEIMGSQDSSETLRIIRDVSNQNIKVAIVGGLLQLTTLIAAGKFIRYQWRKEEIVAEAARTAGKRQASQAWLESQKQKRQ